MKIRYICALLFQSSLLLMDACGNKRFVFTFFFLIFVFASVLCILYLYFLLIMQQLFDSLCAISNEELLLLRTLENSHLNTCQKTRPQVSQIIASIEEFLPVFNKSKVHILLCPSELL